MTAKLDARANQCSHDWEITERWGVVIGLSECKKCGRISRKDDFWKATEAKP